MPVWGGGAFCMSHEDEIDEAVMATQLHGIYVDEEKLNLVFH
jgi:hypothetical protein